MEHEFWLERWQNKEIGWHKENFHSKLVELGKSIFEEGSTIFVPLCGKSKDMIWLAQQGYKIIGSELSQIAVEEFFAEQNLQPKINQVDGFSCYQNGPYKIFVGDFFELKAEYFEDCMAWYDRASLIALPENMRKKYAVKLIQLFRPGSKALVISLTYPDGFRNGPPFSVSVDELPKLWPDVEKLEYLCSAATDLLGRKSQHSETASNNNQVEEHYFELTV